VFKIIASTLLCCALGSLLWCADMCVGASGKGDAECTCLLGGLLAPCTPVSEGGSSSPPAGQSHDACHCLCQNVTLTVIPFVPGLDPTSSPVSFADHRVNLAPAAKDIAHPPRLA